MNNSDSRSDKTPHQNRWNKIAWNGIVFVKPATWEIATIGRKYLMMGTHAHPQMEITWGNPQKSVLHPQDIRKMQSRIRKQHLAAVDPWEPPADWLQALPACETSGFSWKRPDRTCYGLIISCLYCRRVSLIQFFKNVDEPDNLRAVAPRVLSSFMDHTDGDDLLWAVFDMRATLPSVFQIKTYQFSAGFMEMVFFCRGQQISLCRWSPASVLLSGKRLIDFAGSVLPCSDNPAKYMPDANKVEWEGAPSCGFWSRFSSFIPGRFRHQRMLIRHDPENNRILAIKAESRQAMDAAIFDRIFSSYEIAAA